MFYPAFGREDGMSSDRSISKTGSRTGLTGQTAPGSGVRYVGEASMTEVMFDQLEYLLTHQSENCPARCLDCERLKRAGRWLLLPFRPSRRGRPSTPPAESGAEPNTEEASPNPNQPEPPSSPRVSSRRAPSFRTATGRFVRRRGNFRPTL